MSKNIRYEAGAISGQMIAIIALTVLFVAAGSFGIWSYVNYQEQKSNVDAKIAIAEANAKKEQADSDEIKFSEREKEPRRQFTGSDDYGRLTFLYPKTWSAYVARDASNGRGNYEAYLHPGVIPPIGPNQQLALRVMIEDKALETAIKSYDGLVKRGDLKVSPVSFNGHNATRFDGNFSDNIRGSAVVFKLRDKAVTLRTDANTFRPDFDELIKTVDYSD